MSIFKIYTDINMILIDKPYVSDYLISVIKENNLPIVATPIAKKMIPDDSLNWIQEKEAKETIDNNINTPIYSNSENSIGWIEQNLNTPDLIENIQLFKNKIKFRDLLKESYPNYYYKGVNYNQLELIQPTQINFPVILKPSIGFFSIGVHKIDNIPEWSDALKTIKNDIKNLSAGYPKEVIDTTDFIIEEYIEGEEYAIDAYFDKNGYPVVLNILHHRFSSDKDVSDRVYSTAEEIIVEYEQEILDFLKLIGKKTELKNFPLHLEVRIGSNRKIYPIEVNPLRFGGWCTTADLSWFAYGINAYTYFLQNKRPNWHQIFKTRKDKKYSIIVLDNNSGINASNIKHFDYEKLTADFDHILNLRKVNYNQYPIFGFLFVETTPGNEDELNHILTSNLKKYIVS